MTERTLAILGLLLASAHWVCPLDIGITRFLPAADLPEALLRQEIAAFDARFLEACKLHDPLGFLSFSVIDPGKHRGASPAFGELGGLPKIPYLASALDARRVAALYGYGLIVYGRIAAYEDLIDVEVSLYDHELGKTRRKLYARALSGDLAEATDDLARRFVSFMYEIGGVADPASERVPEQNGMILSLGLGSWTAAGRWAEALSGVIVSTFGVRVIPHRPGNPTSQSSAFLRVGGDLKYLFGMNAPGAVASRTHIAELALPFEVCVEAERHSLLVFGVDVGLHTALCWYDVRHDTSGYAVTSVPAVSGSLGYEYRFREDEQFSLGARVAAGVVFFDPAMLHFTAEIYSSISVGPSAGKGGYREK